MALVVKEVRYGSKAAFSGRSPRRPISARSKPASFHPGDLISQAMTISIIGFIVVAVFEPTTRLFGRRLLGRFGVTANWLAEVLAGLFVYLLGGVLIFVFGLLVLNLLHY